MLLDILVLFAVGISAFALGRSSAIRHTVNLIADFQSTIRRLYEAHVRLAVADIASAAQLLHDAVDDWNADRAEPPFCHLCNSASYDVRGITHKDYCPLLQARMALERLEVTLWND